MRLPIQKGLFTIGDVFFVIIDRKIVGYFVSSVIYRQHNNRILYTLEVDHNFRYDYESIELIYEEELLNKIGRKFFYSYKEAEEYYKTHNDLISLEIEEHNIMNEFIQEIKDELLQIKNKCKVCNFSKKLEKIKTGIEKVLSENK